MSGEFTAGSKLPNEQDLSQRLGPLPQLAARGGARAHADRRARAARRRRHLRDEPRARAPAHGHGLHQRPDDGIDGARAAPGAPDPRAGRDRDGGDAGSTRTDLASLERCLADMDDAYLDAGLHRRRRGVPPHHRRRLRQRHARLADPEPLRRHAARPRLALGHRAGRDRDDEAAALGHLQRAARPRRRARARRRPDPSLGGRAVARAADRARGGDRRPRRLAARG